MAFIPAVTVIARRLHTSVFFVNVRSCLFCLLYFAYFFFFFNLYERERECIFVSVLLHAHMWWCLCVCACPVSLLLFSLSVANNILLFDCFLQLTPHRTLWVAYPAVKYSCRRFCRRLATGAKSLASGECKLEPCHWQCLSSAAYTTALLPAVGHLIHIACLYNCRVASQNPTSVFVFI